MIMDEKTFLDLASGKGNAQKMFMQGKIKIKVSCESHVYR